MRVLALVGPTASGKTALSIPLALRLSGEIVSMDSRQLYRGLDIGTDKVRPEVRALVPHHGVDLLDPREHYSAPRFARDTRRWVAEIQGRGRLPILVGGTGFFLRALTDPVFSEPTIDPERRDRLRRLLDGWTVDELARWSARLDIERAGIAFAGGRQRLIRSIEIPLLTGRPLSWWHRMSPPTEAPLPIRVVLLTLPREEMNRRIDLRVDAMLDGGLLDEVRALLDAGIPPDAPGMTAVGYREAVRVLGGTLTVDEARDEIRRATRRYARRQLTWFRNQLGLVPLEIDASTPIEAQVERVVSWWEKAVEGDGSGTGTPVRG